jgi:hypothetical protein
MIPTLRWLLHKLTYCVTIGVMFVIVFIICLFLVDFLFGSSRINQTAHAKNAIHHYHYYPIMR